MNPFKCLFRAYRGMVLGHVVSSKGIEIAEGKVKAILEAVPPMNVNGIASFLGYVNFYRRFVDKLAKLASPMYALTKKEVKLVWNEKCQKGF